MKLSGVSFAAVCLILITSCAPVGVFMVDRATEVAYGGSGEVRRAVRRAGSFVATLRPVHIEGNTADAVAEEFEHRSGTRIVLPFMLKSSVFQLSGEHDNHVVIVGGSDPDPRFVTRDDHPNRDDHPERDDRPERQMGSRSHVYFDDKPALRSAADSIAGFVLDDNGAPQPAENHASEPTAVILLDQESAAARERSEIFLEQIATHNIPSDRMVVEYYEDAPEADELRRTIGRLAHEGGIVVSTLPDERGVIERETQSAGARLALLFPELHATVPSSNRTGGTNNGDSGSDSEGEPVIAATNSAEHGDPVAALQLVRVLELALRASLSVAPGEYGAVETMVYNRL